MKRIPELDYLKGILILLVITFHLVWFEQLHPFAKQVVYTFHMPGFLLISGYLMNVSKPPKDFLRMLLWLAVPYVVMESGYIVMASLLPIREHIEHLTLGVFLDRLLLHPLGPYWYLHTLIICGSLYFLVVNSKFKILGFLRTKARCQGAEQNSKLLLLLRLFLIGLAYCALSFFSFQFSSLRSGAGGTLLTFSLSSSLYFLAGVAIRQTGTDFIRFFRPSWLSPIAFALLVFLTPSPNQASILGALIAYTAISSLLWLYGSLPPRGEVWRGAFFLGRNSLPLYVFSPIFTILCKQFVPYLQFDGTGILFLAVSLPVCVGGSLLIAWLMDLMGISRFFFGRRALSVSC